MVRKSLVLLAAAIALIASGGKVMALSAPPEAHQNAGTLTVNVWGPSEVPEGSCDMWGAGVSGGTEPYEYSWSGVTTADNTQSIVFGSIHGPTPSYTFVTVDVTDANGQNGSGHLVVYTPAASYPGRGC